MMEIGKEVNSEKNYTIMTAVLCWSGMVVMSSLYVTIPLIALFSNIFNTSLTHLGSYRKYIFCWLCYRVFVIWGNL